MKSIRISAKITIIEPKDKHEKKAEEESVYPHVDNHRQLENNPFMRLG